MTNLKRIRKDIGITQAKLSEESGVNVRMIQHYEQGRKPINNAEALTVYKLAQALNCTVEDLLDINESEENDMQYEMKVTIYNPETPKGMTSDLFLKLKCYFAYDSEQYGNGHFLAIKGSEGFENHIDLRYDSEFKRDNKTAYLEKWARTYWSGKNGAYAIKSIEITKVDQ